MPKTSQLIPNLCARLKNFFAVRNYQKAVVGLSGGLDSAVVAALASEALGPPNVTGLILPVAKITSAESQQLAQQLAQQLKIRTAKFELSPVLEACQKFPWPQNSLAQQNLAARLRMLVLFNFANAQNALVLGTSNRSELLLGYGTKFGDLAADVEVLGHFWKTQVREIAKDLKIPRGILTRVPTAELAPGQTDATELAADYAQIDPILQKISQGQFQPRKNSLAQKLLVRVQKNRHKTELIPML